MPRLPILGSALLLLAVLPLAACTEEEATVVEEPTLEEPLRDDPAPVQNTVQVGLLDYEIDMPSEIPSGPTTFSVANEGSTEHSFEIEGQGVEEELSATLQPGETGTLYVTLQPGVYRVYCPVEDHAEAHGMERQVEVMEASTMM